MSVECKICGINKEHSIVEHLKHTHNLTSSEYKSLYDNSPVKSDTYLKKLSENMIKKWEDEDFYDKMKQIRKVTHNKPEFKKNMSNKIKKKYLENPNAFSGITKYHMTDKFKEWVISDDRKLKISETSKNRWLDDEYRKKVIKSIKLRLGDGRCKKNDDFKYKMSNIISDKHSKGEIKNNNNRYKNGKYLSISGEYFYYSSSYELLSMEFFDTCDFIKFWTNKHGIKIKYYYDNFLRNYIPDFLIELVDGSSYIIEMKGWETDEVIVKKKYAELQYNNYLIFYNVKELKEFIYEKNKNFKP